MPYPHHHHQNPCTACCCCTCPYPSAPTLPVDHQQQQQVLQALTTLLFHSASPSPPPIPTIYSSHFLQPQPHHPPIPFPNTHHHQQQQTVLHSLQQRIAALESSLPHFSSQSPRPKQPPQRREPIPTRKARPCASPAAGPAALRPSIRDLAARTIQVAFRRFLVRRSRTLRHLKDLAAIESRVAALRPALSSDKARGHDPRALSQTAMDLLLCLDSIQSGDSLIREGKRSISRELVRILEFIDKVMLKELHHHHNQMALESEENERDHDLANGGTERSSDIDRVWAKKVSFAENRKGLRVSMLDEGNCSAGDRNGFADSLEEEFEGVNVRDHPEPEELHHVSEDERRSEDLIGKNSVRYVNGGNLEMDSRKRDLSAPQPVQMEPRRK